MRSYILLPAFCFAFAHAAPVSSIASLRTRDSSLIPRHYDDTIPIPNEISAPEEQTQSTPTPPVSEQPSTNTEELAAFANIAPVTEPAGTTKDKPTTEPVTEPAPEVPKDTSTSDTTPCRPGSFGCAEKSANTQQILLDAEGYYMANGHAHINFNDQNGLVQSSADAQKICDSRRYMRASQALQQRHCRLCLTSDNDYCVLWDGKTTAMAYDEDK